MNDHDATNPESDALQRLFGGETLAEINQVPLEQLEGVYAEACKHVEGDDFESALEGLLYVVVHDPYDFRFQFGYALCQHQLGQFADAAKHYGLAWMLDPSDASLQRRVRRAFTTASWAPRNRLIWRTNAARLRDS